MVNQLRNNKIEIYTLPRENRQSLKVKKPDDSSGKKKAVFITPSIFLDHAKKIVKSGVKNIEIGGFTNVEAFKFDKDLIPMFLQWLKSQGDKYSDLKISAIAPNSHYAKKAVNADIRDLAAITSVSPLFGKNNLLIKDDNDNAYSAENEKSFKAYTEKALKKLRSFYKGAEEGSLKKNEEVKTSVYVSCSIDEAVSMNGVTENKISSDQILDFIQQIINLKKDNGEEYKVTKGDIIICDSTNNEKSTIAAYKQRLEDFFKNGHSETGFKLNPENIRLHLHGADTKDLLKKIDIARDYGIYKFDTIPINEGGGCTALDKPVKNLPLEDLVKHLHEDAEDKVDTGIDLNKVKENSKSITEDYQRITSNPIFMEDVPKLPSIETAHG